MWKPHELLIGLLATFRTIMRFTHYGLAFLFPNDNLFNNLSNGQVEQSQISADISITQFLVEKVESLICDPFWRIVFQFWSFFFYLYCFYSRVVLATDTSKIRTKDDDSIPLQISIGRNNFKTIKLNKNDSKILLHESQLQIIICIYWPTEYSIYRTIIQNNSEQLLYTM